MMYSYKQLFCLNGPTHFNTWPNKPIRQKPVYHQFPLMSVLEHATELLSIAVKSEKALSTVFFPSKLVSAR